MVICERDTDLYKFDPLYYYSDKNSDYIMKFLFMLLCTVNLIAQCFKGAESTTFIVKNQCSSTIWPATLSGSGSPRLPSTGFALSPGASTSLNIPSHWSGRLWGRSLCSTDATGKFRCGTGDCGSGKITCDGRGGAPPASLVEFTLGDIDYYDISLVDGFNLPLSVTPQGGPSQCHSTSCRANINQQCPKELALKGSGGTTIGCNSACVVFHQPRYCCTGAYGSPKTCHPTSYSTFFKSRCPQAYGYAYDDKSSTFTCKGGANYLITFCP